MTFGTLTLAAEDYEAGVEVEYALQPSLARHLPIRMREHYRDPGKPKGDHLEVVSEYSNFRRFDVKTSEDVQLPK